MHITETVAVTIKCHHNHQHDMKKSTTILWLEMFKMNYETQKHTHNQKGKCLCSGSQDIRVHHLLLSCHVMSPEWPKPGHKHFNTIKTEKCRTRDEIAEEHNNLEPNKRHVDCILRVGPDSSHTVFIESITAAEAFSNTHNQQFAFKWRSFFFVDATSSANTNPLVRGSLPCASAIRILMLPFLIFFTGGGGAVGVCVGGEEAGGDMTAMPVSQLA